LKLPASANLRPQYYLRVTSVKAQLIFTPWCQI